MGKQTQEGHSFDRKNNYLIQKADIDCPVQEIKKTRLLIGLI